jgi:hypothetical protein
VYTSLILFERCEDGGEEEEGRRCEEVCWQCGTFPCTLLPSSTPVSRTIRNFVRVRCRLCSDFILILILTVYFAYSSACCLIIPTIFSDTCYQFVSFPPSSSLYPLSSPFLFLLSSPRFRPAPPCPALLCIAYCFFVTSAGASRCHFIIREPTHSSYLHRLHTLLSE